ncbi:hypothetical protein I6M74_21130 [Acinetobacter bereziniae]|uniref:hypothetical protein n=1 Tax=Acinetobacter bereziniae TaxID=106648 RepID=UPI0019026374|nr:hypothetical protein [Acinetobacter bereziniae]MBJ8424379.1 hypothetical protein [Acinetobacter bereziniae]
MGTDQTTEQLNQCLTALASANQHWWEYFAITQSQSDMLSVALMKIMIGAISYGLISLILKKA